MTVDDAILFSPTPDDEPAGLRVVPVEEFSAVDEASADPLLGDDDNTVLSAGGMLVFYGKGGGGKTTLEIDLAMHLAAGAPWLGLAVPRRCRILLIENEGPRGKFRRKLRSKLAAWRGPSVEGYLHVLETPWASFTFADDHMRAQLAAIVREGDIDILAAGPVQRLGVTGGGTPEEVAAFVGLLERLRADLDRPLAGAFVHHENKGGTVSGAWEGVPDTLAHVSAQGNGGTRVEWEKVRWGSDLHGRTWRLLWREGESFELDETPENTDEDIRAAILVLVEAEPGCSANAIEKGVKGNNDRVRSARDELLAEGELVNLGSGRGGTGGGGMKLYVAGAEPDGEAFAHGGANGRAKGERPPLGGPGGSVRPSPLRKEKGEGGERGPTRCVTCGKRGRATEPGEPVCHCGELGMEPVEDWRDLLPGDVDGDSPHVLPANGHLPSENPARA